MGSKRVDATVACVACDHPPPLHIIQKVLKKDPSLVASYDTPRKRRMQSELNAVIAGCRSAIQEYERVISDLEYQGNACFSLACQIPDDVLEEIFSTVARTMNRYLELFNLGRICRHWRNIALSCGRLWSRIKITPHERFAMARTKTLISRSLTAPLDIDLHYPHLLDTVGREDPLKFILSPRLLARTRRLRLTLPYNIILHDIPQLLANPAPLLQSLSLIAARHGTYAHSATGSFLVSPDFFPLLSSLTMEDVQSLWPLPLVEEKAAAIDIRIPAATPAHASHFDTSFRLPLFRSLCKMPELEVLRLTFDSLVMPPNIVTKTLRFPRLKDLQLAGKPEAVSAWLEIVEPGLTANIQLQCEIHHCSARVLSHLADEISSLIQSPWGAENFPEDALYCASLYDMIPRSRIDHTTLNAHIRLWTKPYHRDKAYDQRYLHLPTGQLCIVISNCSSSNTPTHHFNPLWRALPLSWVHTFAIVVTTEAKTRRYCSGAIPLLSDPAITTLLDKLHSVELLYIKNLNPADSEVLLASRLSQSHPEGDQHDLLFPSVRRLTLERISVGNAWERRMIAKIASESGIKDPIELVRAVIRERYARGSVLEEVRLVTSFGVADSVIRDVVHTKPKAD